MFETEEATAALDEYIAVRLRYPTNRAAADKKRATRDKLLAVVEENPRCVEIGVNRETRDRCVEITAEREFQFAQLSEQLEAQRTKGVAAINNAYEKKMRLHRGKA